MQKKGRILLIVYLNEDNDAATTKELVEKEGQKCILLPGDIGDESFCQNVVSQTIQTFGGLDILVNNAAEQHVQTSILDITSQQLMKTFHTNIFSMFYLTKAALPHLKKGSSIINTASITAYKGHPKLIDYSSTKGAIVSFTRALSIRLLKMGFVSMLLLQVQYGHLLFPHHLMNKTWRNSEVIHQWHVLDSQMN